MTVDHPQSSVARVPVSADILLDGLFTGMIGAIAVAVWFLVLDVAAGRPLFTPNLLGNVLLRGSAIALRTRRSAPSTSRPTPPSTFSCSSPSASRCRI
jgi:hypothetical protein